MPAMIQPGRSAPAFTLPDQDGTSVSLSAMKGSWVVLYFYPRDDTPGCTVEAHEFTALQEEFRKHSAEVLGCSPDSPEKHTKFIAKCGLGVRLLADTDRKVMTKYDAFGKKMLYGKEVEGVIRSTVLIGPDGKVAHHWRTVKAKGHAAAVLAKLGELQGGGAGAMPAGEKTTAKKATKKAAAKKAAKK
jgi:peroxiredoxin Q/BCP